ncbi:DUF4097 family beta strand repeat-containing protein [Streptomyces sp. URMC 123]|uniref:DUF4097 family beta strand repeat-containing protein n=1 Tax=Streptomyces sp. URMC 123 TaxID=3423403 RepID=UPI003F1C775A
MSEWSVSEPRELSFAEPVVALDVRLVSGTVNVVGTHEPTARLEVSALEGPPLVVTHREGVLIVAYEDLPWKGFRSWPARQRRRRRAVVSLTVPAGARVRVATVDAVAVVSGVSGRTEVQGVSGDTTLVGLSGQVEADTVSGALETQALTGPLRFSSVSGDLTLVDGAGPAVRADSVSGDLMADLLPHQTPDLRLDTVSGEVAVRLPYTGDSEVDAKTTAGRISCVFDGLRVDNQWGSRRLRGRLGSAAGKLAITTLSGSVALLRRAEDDARLVGAAPAGGPAPSPSPSSPSSPSGGKVL